MNVATYLSCYFQHPASLGPVLEESLPAIVVLVEHPASPGPLLEESLTAVVILVEQLTLTDHESEGVDSLDTSYKGR